MMHCRGGEGDKWQVNKPIIVKLKQWQEMEGIFHKVPITVSLANKQLIKIYSKHHGNTKYRQRALTVLGIEKKSILETSQ